MVIQGVSYLSDFEAKKAIIETARRLEAKGFLTAGDGSLSVRVGPNAVWVTVDGADKAALTQDGMVRVDLNGKANLSAHPKPLGEDLPIHLKIYRENENVAEQSRSGKGVLLEHDGCMFWAKSPVEVSHLAEALNYRWTVGDAIHRSGCVGCQGCGGCTGNSQCSTWSGCQGTQAPPPEPPRTLTGVTELIQPGQPLPPLPQNQEPGQPLPPLPQNQEPAPEPVQPSLPLQPPPPAAGPRADAMAEVVRRVLQGMA